MSTMIALLTAALAGLILTGIYLHFRPLEPGRAKRPFKPTVITNIVVFFGAQLVITIIGVNDALAAPEVEAAMAGGADISLGMGLAFIGIALPTAGSTIAAGATQAHYVGIITPNNIFLLQMSLVVAMAVIGGIENFVAAAIGAIIIEFVLEMLRNSFEIGGVTIDMTIWRLVFFGILLMLTLRFSRNGLISPIIEYFTRGPVGA